MSTHDPDPSPSPPAPQTDLSTMFDDDDDDDNAIPSVSLTPIRKNTTTLFLPSPAGSEVSRSNDHAGIREKKPDGDRPSKRQRMGTNINGTSSASTRQQQQRDPPTSTGRAPPRTAAQAQALMDDPFAGLDDLDYTRRYNGLEEEEGQEGQGDGMKDNRKNNVYEGGDLIDPMAMMGRRRRFDGEEDEPVVKVRRVIPKLDADRLLSEKGLPTLVRESRKFRIKGKGHEATDLNNLLTMYQFWAHQMFPKSTFKEAALRVESLCHSRIVKNAMEQYHKDEREAREAMLEDLSPIGSPTSNAGDLPAADTENPTQAGSESRPTSSSNQLQQPDDQDDDMDIDAMIAQAEQEAMALGSGVGVGGGSVGLAGRPSSGVAHSDDMPPEMPSMDEDYDDDEAMRAMEIDAETEEGADGANERTGQGQLPKLWGNVKNNVDEEEDADWEAMAAMEAEMAMDD